MSLDIVEIVDEVSENAIEHAFGIPGGGTSLELIDKLLSRNVSFHTTHFEGSAAIMAGIVGRLSNKVGIAISIKGPGVANMVPGLAFCAFENLPLVAMTEAYAPEVSLDRAHKRVDHQILTAPIVKCCTSIENGKQGFLKAYIEAREEIPGPTVLELVVGEHNCSATDSLSKREPTRGHFSNYLSRSNKPIVIVGSFGIREDLGGALTSLQIPVFSTASAKGIVPETADNSAGIYTGAGLEFAPESPILKEADLVIGIGLRNTEVLVAKMFPCPSINFDSVKNSFESGFHFNASFDMSGIPELFEELNRKNWGIELVQGVKKDLMEHLFDSNFLPFHVFRMLNQECFGDTRLVMDTGYFCTVGEHVWAATSADLYLSSGNSRYMGAGLPIALGACLWEPERPTILAVGDGGIGMYISEIKLAVKKRLPLLVLFLSDGGFGSIRDRAIKDQLAQEPLVMDGSSWTKVMEGFEVESVQVNSESCFSNALETWNPSNGPSFIECSFDPERYRTISKGLRG